MILLLKNKLIIALDKVLEDSLKVEGIPKQVLFTLEEGVEFIRELNALPYYKPSIVLVRTDGNIDGWKNINQQIFHTARITVEALTEIVTLWKDDKLFVFYDSIQIKIVKQSAADPNQKHWLESAPGNDLKVPTSPPTGTGPST